MPGHSIRELVSPSHVIGKHNKDVEGGVLYQREAVLAHTPTAQKNLHPIY